MIPEDVKIIAIDGPAGSGKSSISRAAAQKLSYGYLDTGAAYRCFSAYALAKNVPAGDSVAIKKLLSKFEYKCSLLPFEQKFLVANKDYTDLIRKPNISEAVSAYARITAVREYLNSFFRKIVTEASVKNNLDGVFVEGRDVGSAVFPEACYRVLLNAREEIRAARRNLELGQDAHKDVTVLETLKSLSARDEADSKVANFMQASEGVITLDTSDISFDESVDALVAIVS